jgi:tRNA G10  N-methylase Trm11
MKILDATCGQRNFWFDKHQKDTIFIDIRPEVNPDKIMDCTHTNFLDKTFDLIVFDPPHVSLTSENKGIFGKRYGTFTANQIRSLIKNAFIEFHRILRDGGFVVFKWNDHDQKLKTILPLILNFEILFGQKTAEKSKHRSSTYWFCLIKNLNSELNNGVLL